MSFIQFSNTSIKMIELLYQYKKITLFKISCFEESEDFYSFNKKNRTNIV